MSSAHTIQQALFRSRYMRIILPTVKNNAEQWRHAIWNTALHKKEKTEVDQVSF